MDRRVAPRAAKLLEFDAVPGGPARVGAVSKPFRTPGGDTIQVKALGNKRFEISDATGARGDTIIVDGIDDITVVEKGFFGKAWGAIKSVAGAAVKAGGKLLGGGGCKTKTKTTYSNGQITSIETTTSCTP
jgi:hypothetical protein